MFARGIDEIHQGPRLMEDHKVGGGVPVMILFARDFDNGEALDELGKLVVSGGGGE